MARRIGSFLGSVAITLALLELALRAAPGALLPLKLLKRFRAEVRLEIADRLGLPSASQMRVLERDDGGPELQLRKPGTLVTWDFKSENERGAFEMDSQGFCNAPRDRYERGEIELIAVGDSFTECLVASPEATWPSQLGALAGRSVYSLGKGGIGPYEYLQILKRFGLEKRPRVVVMNLYEGNDLRDAVRHLEYVEAARAGRAQRTLAGDRNEDPFDYQAALDHPLGRHSYALNLVVVALGQAWEGVRNAVVRTLGGKAPEHVNFRYALRFPGASVPFNPQNADESEVRVARLLRAGEVSLGAFDLALEGFAALAREHGFAGIVSYSPSAHTAYAPWVEFEDPSLGPLLAWFSAAQRQHVAERCAALGLAFADLTPALQAAARERGERELLYFPVNVHYTEAGHRLVAETLAGVLAGRGAAAAAGP
jgi:hypothetical protein